MNFARSLQHLLATAFLAASVGFAGAQGAPAAPEAPNAAPGKPAKIDVGAVREEARREARSRAEGRMAPSRVRSVTYKLGDQEVTRYFLTERSEAGIRVVETATPGGDPIPATEESLKNMGWIMNELGFKPAEAAEGEAKPAEGRGAGANRMATGPDGKQYRAVSRTRQGDSEPLKTTIGPNGEMPVRVEPWVKRGDTWEVLKPGERRVQRATEAQEKAEKAVEESKKEAESAEQGAKQEAKKAEKEVRKEGKKAQKEAKKAGKPATDDTMQ